MKIKIVTEIENEAAMKHIIDQIASTVFRGDTSYLEVTRTE